LSWRLLLRVRRQLGWRLNGFTWAPRDLGVEVEKFPARLFSLLAELSSLISFKAPFRRRARLGLRDNDGERRDYRPPHKSTPSDHNRIRGVFAPVAADKKIDLDLVVCKCRPVGAREINGRVPKDLRDPCAEPL
jgi:hypothetical protein